MKEKPIVAISTPLGIGAVCIVRLSGEESLNIAKELFNSKSLNYEEIKPRYMYFGNFCFGDVQEQCLMVYFKAPFSYTGEDVVEFQCHGGDFLAEKILDACLKTGAILAQSGEFTKRAFVNGKISLDKAESVIDIINAQSESELRAGYQLMNGTLQKKVKEMQNRLTDFLASVQVALDYPEHDIDYETMQQTKSKLTIIKNEIKSLLENSRAGEYIRHGINVAIVGKPNVGKSSVLNALLGEERAIVTDIAGTTRDTIKETILYNGIKINFIDTAGLRETTDLVEKIGVERSKKQFSEADLILFVIDNSEKISDEEKKYIQSLKTKNYLIIINKIDKNREINDFFNNFVAISALNNENINKLKEKIIEKTIENKIDFSGLVLTNSRHIRALENALKLIDKCLFICDNESADILAMEIKFVWEELGKITGETENENIIDAIFSKFCLGK